MQWDEHRIAENHKGNCLTSDLRSAHHLRWWSVGIRHLSAVRKGKRISTEALQRVRCVCDVGCQVGEEV